MSIKNWTVTTALCVLCMAGAGKAQAQKVYKEGTAVVMDFGPDSGFPQEMVETITGKKTYTNPSNTSVNVNNLVEGTFNKTLYKKLEIATNDLNTSSTWEIGYQACMSYGWRLPTQRELAFMIVFHKALTDLGVSGFSTSGAYYYWSATEVDPISALCGTCYSITVNMFPKSSTNIRTRCVREIP